MKKNERKCVGLSALVVMAVFAVLAVLAVLVLSSPSAAGLADIVRSFVQAREEGKVSGMAAYNIGTDASPSYAILSGISFGTSGGGLGEEDAVDAGEVSGVHAWGVGPWENCSSACGTGTGTRDVFCVDMSNHVVDDALCVLAAKPESSGGCVGECLDVSFSCDSWDVSGGTIGTVSSCVDGMASFTETWESGFCALGNLAAFYSPKTGASLGNWQAVALPDGEYRLTFSADGCAVSEDLRYQVSVRELLGDGSQRQMVSLYGYSRTANRSVTFRGPANYFAFTSKCAHSTVSRLTSSIGKVRISRIGD